MRAIALLTLLFAAPVLAQDGVPFVPDDRPVVLKIEFGTLSVDGTDVRAGPGIYFNEPAAVAIAKKLKELDTENAVLKQEIRKQSGPPVWVLVVGGLVATGLGVGIGVAISSK